ncbi:MAG: hypothetical protein KGP27_00705 [Hyphomicrobiales bacterium]|nr:hypothetical protein [Hyphomicrobiales bacterium]
MTARTGRLGGMALALFIASGAGRASAACDVKALPPSEHIAHAVAIFEGEVVRLRPAPRPSGTLRTAAVFKVLDAYKGARTGSEVPIALDSSECGLHPAVGEKLTVFVESWIGTPVYNKVSMGRFGDPALAEEYSRLLAAEKAKRN